MEEVNPSTGSIDQPASSEALPIGVPLSGKH